jgi:regulator of sigma E protease
MNAALAWAVVVAGVWGYGRTFGGQFARVPVTLAPVIDSVVPGMPAALGGLRKGDSVVAIGGAAVADWTQVVERVSSSPGVALSLDVARADGSRATVVVTPELAPADTTGTPRVGKVGVLPAPHVRPAPASLGQAVRDGSQITGLMFKEVVKVVKGLFLGEVSVRQLGGPLRIAQVSYQVARSGLEPLLVLVAFLSVNLAVLNLLPIPVLDGGAIVMRVIEAAKGGPLSQRTQEYVMRFGVLVILTLFLIVNFNDIVSFFS